MKGKLSDYKCDMCKEEDETQKHIYTCKEIKRNTTINTNIQYEEINGSNVNKQTEIAREIIKHMKIIKETIKENNYTQVGPSDHESEVLLSVTQVEIYYYYYYPIIKGF